MSASSSLPAEPPRGGILLEAGTYLAAYLAGYLVLALAIFVTATLGGWLGLPWLGLAGLALFTVALAILAVRLTIVGHPAAASLGPLVALLSVIVLFGAIDVGWHWPDSSRANFFTLATLTTAAAQTCTVAVAALGMTIIIIAAGIDLSVGTAIGLCAMVAAWLIHAGYGFALGLAGGILTGVVAGLLNGQLISYLNVVPFIITLGTMAIFKGLNNLIGSDRAITPPRAELPDAFQVMLTQYPEPAWLAWPLAPNLPWGVWLVLGLAILVAGLLQYTVFGRHVLAIGANETAARLCGINVPLVRIQVYALAGLFVGIAGIYHFARLRASEANGGEGLELRIIAAVVIGGGSLSGGRGSVLGTLCGAALMQTIQSGCSALQVSNSIQYILIAVIIIAAVTLDQYREGKLTSENLRTVFRGVFRWQ
jgi:ribose transport system permease protein